MKPKPGTFLHETRRAARWVILPMLAAWLVILVLLAV